MKTKITALALFAFTAIGVAIYPVIQNVAAVERIKPIIPVKPIAPLTNERPKVELVFALDTTGSMGGMIQAAKEKIWSIATTMASAQPAPEIRIGLVAYRDRGDEYVTRVVDLSSDLDSVYASLMDFKARGGGDGPESVNQGLYDAVHKISWSSDPQAYKVLFLVGDAPPHMDYQDDVKYPETINAAMQKGIVVNAIQCGEDNWTHREWQKIAQLGEGSFFNVAQDGSALALSTPYDDKLAKLSRELDETRLYYGSKKQKEEKKRKMEASKKLHEGSSSAALARRAEFNASPSGAENFLGGNELVEDIATGRADLDSIPKTNLPEPIQAMSPEEQKVVVGNMAKKRAELKKQIKQLSDDRTAYLRDKVDENLAEAEESLDQKVFDALRSKAKDKGLVLEERDLKY